MSDNFENLKEFVKAQLAFLLVTAGNSNIQLQYEENLVCYKIHKNNFANTHILSGQPGTGEATHNCRSHPVDSSQNYG